MKKHKYLIKKEPIDMKKIVTLILMLTLVFTFAACSGGESDPISTAYPTTPVSQNEPTVINNTQPTIEIDSDDLDSSWDDSEVSYIKLEGNSIALNGGGATVDGSKITITSAGTYTAHKSNLSAPTWPTVNDDSTQGYSPGSVWVSQVQQDSWICIDATPGAAVWRVSAGGLRLPAPKAVP